MSGKSLCSFDLGHSRAEIMLPVIVPLLLTKQLQLCSHNIPIGLRFRTLARLFQNFIPPIQRQLACSNHRCKNMAPEKCNRRVQCWPWLLGQRDDVRALSLYQSQWHWHIMSLSQGAHPTLLLSRIKTSNLILTCTTSHLSPSGRPCWIRGEGDSLFSLWTLVTLCDQNKHKYL